MMLLLVLLLLPPSHGDGLVKLEYGENRDGLCVCTMDPKLSAFPALKYEAVLQQIESCGGSMTSLQEELLLSSQRLPDIEAVVENITVRLEPHLYLHDRGLYTALSLRELGEELSQLKTDIGAVHSQINTAKTKKLSNEVDKLVNDVNKMQTSDTTNIKSVRTRLRYLKNSVESSKSIPKDFRGQDQHCIKGLLTSISEPVVTKISPYGTGYTFGSWGKQAKMDSEAEKNFHWVQPLLTSNVWANTVRIYKTYEDFMGSTNHRDYTIAPSYNHPSANEGPNAVLYGDGLYYHCYQSADICRFNLSNNAVTRVKLPGIGVGYNNRFPYCYYDCRSFSDVDLEADETGLWAIYATVGNHGNLVLSRLDWNSTAKTLTVTQTWETRLFKKAVTNAFMVCGVMYATRYVDGYREEVFYAFDTATGKEDNTLALPLEKVAKGVASLSYNPTNKQIYMYNDGYLLAYQAYFI